MTVVQALTVAQGIDMAWQVTAVTAWLTAAIALIWVAGRVTWPLMPDLAWVATSTVQVGRGAHAHGRHHRWTHGRHRADRIQHPGAGEKLDGPPTTAPAQPAPTGRAR